MIGGEEKIRALIRDEIRAAFKSMAVDADMYLGGAAEVTVEAAHVVKDVAETVVRLLTPAPEPEPCHHAYATNAKGASICQLCDERLPQVVEPASPFEPKHTARQWADTITNLFRLAKDDGYSVWVDVEDYFGPGPFIRISPENSPTWDTDPIIGGTDD